jgi:DNA-binding transcriptional LysR family regulator
MPWFHRQASALVLTRAGRACLADERKALQRIGRAATHVSALKMRAERLRLSVASWLFSYWLVPRLPTFTRQHP